MTQRIIKCFNHIKLVLTAGQYTGLGKLVGDMYYRTDLLELVESHGYPHNGGQHTLTVQGNSKDLLSFLELVIDTFSKHPRYSEGLADIIEMQNELRTMV